MFKAPLLLEMQESGGLKTTGRVYFSQMEQGVGPILAPQQRGRAVALKLQERNPSCRATRQVGGWGQDDMGLHGSKGGRGVGFVMKCQV